MNCKKGFTQCAQIGCDCFRPWAKGLLSTDHKQMIINPPSMQFMTQSVREELQAYIHKLERIIQACEAEIEYQSSAYDELASEVKEWFLDRPHVAETIDRKCYPALTMVVDD